MSEISEIDQIRINELVKNIDSSSSRSFFYRSTEQLQNYNRQKKFINSIFFNYDNQINSLLPISFNDGLFYPARGWQEKYSFGLNIKWKLIDLNLQPEFLKVQNASQEAYYGNPEDGNFAAKYFGSVANNIDYFRKFGETNIDTFTFGQSRIGILFNNLSIGYSNQNIWWGPGKRNSISFTNNPGGFKHFYFNTNKPIISNIGNFEFSLIKGILDTNKYKDPDVDLLWNYRSGIANKNLDKREIFAFSGSFEPFFLKNLFIGYSYVFQNYKSQKNIFNVNYSFFSKDKPKMDLGAIFFRLKLPKENSEIYAEIGIKNNSPSPINFFQNDAKTAYIVGLTNITNLKNSFLNLNIEFSQFQLMDPKDLFYPGAPFVGGLFNSWYTDPYIKQGYSNQGQLLGASIGPGSNSQTIVLSWNTKISNIGFLFERIVHNNDFYYVVYLNGHYGDYDPNIGQLRWGYYNKYWVDLNNKAFVNFKINKKIFLNVSYMKTNSMNYRWIRYEDGSKYDEPSTLTDKFNFQFQISFKYLIYGIFK